MYGNVAPVATFHHDTKKVSVLHHMAAADPSPATRPRSENAEKSQQGEEPAQVGEMLCFVPRKVSHYWRENVRPGEQKIAARVNVRPE